MTHRHRFGRLMLMGLCLVISGCAAPLMMLNPPTVQLASEQEDAEAKRFQPPPGKSSIYVIREDAFAGQNVLFQVRLNGKDQGELSRGTYFLFTVPPGKHVVDFAQAGGPDPRSGTETISVVEGAIYCFEIRPRSGLTAPPTNIYPVELQRGKQLILGGKRAKIKPAE